MQAIYPKPRTAHGIARVFAKSGWCAQEQGECVIWMGRPLPPDGVKTFAFWDRGNHAAVVNAALP
jgi:hypothetical protein